ncbi:MAG: helix-turn-helix protein [Paenibacillaceae bacterium]|nr:helix-turn-helix protein [Paenibacillaceae bacterium]
MELSKLPACLSFGKKPNSRPVQVEFDRRSMYYTMTANHFHSEYELYYLFTGERYYFIKDRTYTILAGDLVMIDSEEVHKTANRNIPIHERLVLYYQPAFFAALPAEERELLLSVFKRDNPVLRLNLQERLMVEELLLDLLEELLEKPPGYSLRVEQIGVELLLFTARILLKKEAVAAEVPSPAQLKMTEIIRHINTQYSEPLDLDGLSARFFISKSHLSRTFKEFTGFGFSEYLILTRIKEAQQMLRGSTKSITEIAAAAGFDNFSHFGKTFKKAAGMSPRQYRAIHQNSTRG